MLNDWAAYIKSGLLFTWRNEPLYVNSCWRVGNSNVNDCVSIANNNWTSATRLDRKRIPIRTPTNPIKRNKPTMRTICRYKIIAFNKSIINAPVNFSDVYRTGHCVWSPPLHLVWRSLLSFTMSTSCIHIYTFTQIHRAHSFICANFGMQSVVLVARSKRGGNAHRAQRLMRRAEWGFRTIICNAPWPKMHPFLVRAVSCPVCVFGCVVIVAVAEIRDNGSHTHTPVVLPCESGRTISDWPHCVRRHDNAANLIWRGSPANWRCSPCSSCPLVNVWV